METTTIALGQKMSHALDSRQVAQELLPNGEAALPKLHDLYAVSLDQNLLRLMPPGDQVP